MATSPVPVDDDVGVGLNVADDDVVVGDNGWCWFIVCKIDEWICCKLCLTIRADGLFDWFGRIIGGSIVRIVAVEGLFISVSTRGKIWFVDWDLTCTNDCDLGVNVTVDIWLILSFCLFDSSIELIKFVEPKDLLIVDICGGGVVGADGGSFVRSLRCLIDVIARLNCVVNFCFGFASIDEIGVDIGESCSSWESDCIIFCGTSGLALWRADDILNIFLLIVFSKFILPRFRPTRAAKEEEKSKIRIIVFLKIN